VIVRETDLPGVKIVEPRVFGDDRGFFLESFNAARFEDLGLPTSFVQDNHSRSVRNVVRGLHYQLRQPQGKLVRVVRGAILDIAVDIRVGSPHFGRWTGVELSDENLRMLWIPPGFAHGFAVLSDVADVVYKCTALYAPDDDFGVLWSDPGLAIDWSTASPILSEKDMRYQALSPARHDLPAFVHE
jgi:dTDP-4-dehydrorhamnose 3,5-epimerase